MNDPLSYDELDAALVRLELSTDASELHGSLCGYLCGGGVIGSKPLAQVLELDQDALAAGTPADQDVLARLVHDSSEELADPELGFEPLLPADDRPLPERAEALAAWCKGFLGGFGLAGAHPHGDLSEEAKEILRDLGAIAAAELDFGDEGEDEDALIEVQEFVRMTAMLLFAEAGARRPDGQGTVH